MSSLERVTSHRCWIVHDFAVWGRPTLGELDLLLYESPTATGEIFFSTAEIGDSAQTVEFSQLTDHRGNQLPSIISAPHIIIRPRSADSVFLIGYETNSAFAIAHDADLDSPVLVDLFITEMGE